MCGPKERMVPSMAGTIDNYGPGDNSGPIGPTVVGGGSMSAQQKNALDAKRKNLDSQRSYF